MSSRIGRHQRLGLRGRLPARVPRARLRIVTTKGEVPAASVTWDAHTHNEGKAVALIGDPSTSGVIGPYWRGVDVSSAVSRPQSPKSTDRSCRGGSGGHNDHSL